MNDLITVGKKRTILISISILLISIWSIYFEQSSKLEIEYPKLVRQIVRFILTIGLLYLVYSGKNWARIVSIVLFSFAILIAIIALIGIDANFLNKIPFMVLIFIYGFSIYFFSFSKSFKEFSKYQNSIHIEK